HQVHVARITREAALEPRDFGRGRRFTIRIRPAAVRGGRNAMKHAGKRGEQSQRPENAADPPQGDRHSAHDRHQSLPDQSSTPGPIVAAAAAPSARNVPNGSAYLSVPRLAAIKINPTMVPLKDASTRVNSVSFHPTNAPIIASILTSPKPSPSSWRSR